MKKILFSIFSFLFALLLISTTLPKYTHAGIFEEDQYCDNEAIQNVDGYWKILSHTSLSQTFTPTQNHLTKVELAIAGGADVNALIKMDVYVVGGGLATTKTVTTTSENPAWVEFFITPITLDTTKQYKITVTTTSSTAYWVVSPTPCYAGGNAIIDTSPAPDQDFGFVTLGGNYDDEEEDVEPDPGSDIPITIAKPTSLTAEFISEFDGVKVDWTASTTADITGYHIYRSESSTTGFTKIGTVAKTITEYTEQADFEEETTYYYIVKAYKGTVLSAASNTASVDIPLFEETTEEETEEGDEVVADMVDDSNTESQTKRWLNNIINYIIGGAIILIAIAVIVIILIARKKKSKDIKGEVKKEDIKLEKTTDKDSDEEIHFEEKKTEKITDKEEDEEVPTLGKRPEQMTDKDKEEIK